jgi:hypothetical protein
MTQVFLSYDLKDSKQARQLADKLTAAGLSVWDAARELLPGDNWALKLGKALEESDAMIVLVSPESVDSPWVRREIEYAVGVPKYKGRLIPVVVRPTPRIPWVLRQFELARADNQGNGSVARKIVEQLKRAG